MSSGPNLVLSTPTLSLDPLGPLSWWLPSLRNTRPTSRLETRAQYISWSQGRSISHSLPQHPCLSAGVFFLLLLSTFLSDVIHYSGMECSFYLSFHTSILRNSVLDNCLLNHRYLGNCHNQCFIFKHQKSPFHATQNEFKTAPRQLISMEIWRPQYLYINFINYP